MTTSSPDLRRLAAYVSMAATFIVAPFAASTVSAQEIAVGRNPGSVALSPDAKTLFVANRGDNTISVIDTDAAKSVGQITVGGIPGTIAVSPDGRTAYVALTIGMQGGVAILNTSSRRVTTVPTPCPVRDLAIVPNGGKLYLAEEYCGLHVLRLTDRSTTVIDQRLCPEWVAATPDGGRAYVNYQCNPAGRRTGGHDAVIEFDARTDRPLRMFAGPDDDPLVNVGGPIAVSPNGDSVWANGVDACRYSQFNKNLDPVDASRTAAVCGRNAADKGIINVIEIASGEIHPMPFLPHEVGTQLPLGASTPTFFPDGRKVAVATGSRILIFDAGTLNQIDADYPVPQAGRLAFTPDGRTAYVASAAKNVVTILSFEGAPGAGLVDRAWRRYIREWTDSPVGMIGLHFTVLLALWAALSVAFARVFAQVPVLKLPLELEVYVRGHRSRLIRAYLAQLGESVGLHRERRGARTAVPLPITLRRSGTSVANTIRTDVWIPPVVDAVVSKPRYNGCISGTGGAGKTFLMEELVLAFIRGGCVPILFQGTQFDEKLSFEEWLDQVLRAARVPIGSGLLRSLDHVVFVIDQASEVRPSHQHAFWKMIGGLFQPGAADTHVIVAGRGLEETARAGALDLTWDDDVRMAPLADEDIRALGQEYLDPSGKSAEVQALPDKIRAMTASPTPFIVSAYARAKTSSARPIADPEDLYGEILDRYMRPDAGRLRPDLAKLVLQDMVRRHYRTNGSRGLPLERYAIEKDTSDIFVARRFKEMYGEANVPEPSEFVKLLLESGLVYRTSSGYLFFHDSFEDWLGDAQAGETGT